jgi:hypothetical protein
MSGFFLTEQSERQIFMIKTVGILGAGSVGSALIYEMYQRDPDNVCLLARGDRAERIKAKGISVNNDVFFPRVYSDLSEGPAPDLLILAAKTYSMDSVVDDLHALSRGLTSGGGEPLLAHHERTEFRVMAVGMDPVVHVPAVIHEKIQVTADLGVLVSVAVLAEDQLLVQHGAGQAGTVSTLDPSLGFLGGVFFHAVDLGDGVLGVPGAPVGQAVWIL